MDIASYRASNLPRLRYRHFEIDGTNIGCGLLDAQLLDDIMRICVYSSTVRRYHLASHQRSQPGKQAHLSSTKLRIGGLRRPTHGSMRTSLLQPYHGTNNTIPVNHH